MGPELAQVAYVITKALRNGRCKRHGGASTGPTHQTFGKDHYRYVHGLKTQEVIIKRKVVADMHKSLRGL